MTHIEHTTNDKDDQKIGACKKCGKHFRMNVYWQSYCSGTCRTAAHHKQKRATITELKEQVRELKQKLETAGYE